MKIEINKEATFEKVHHNKEHNCEEYGTFSDYLEKSIIELKEMEEEEKISIFVEKKTDRKNLDVFDTLIDI